MLYWRMMRKDEPNIVAPPSNFKNDIIDYVYSNSMKSHNLYKGDRIVWSLAKTPEAALKWLGVRGKGRYDRLAVYDFDGTEGDFYDLSDIKAWLSLIDNSSKGAIINNINGSKIRSVEAIRSIIPCMNSALSLSKECEEVVFIPRKQIEFKVITDYSTIVRNSDHTVPVLTQLSYSNQTIDTLINQLETYNIVRKETVRNQLLELKSA